MVRIQGTVQPAARGRLLSDGSVVTVRPSDGSTVLTFEHDLDGAYAPAVAVRRNEVSARADAPGDALSFHPRRRSLEEDTVVGEPGRLSTGTDTAIPTVAQAREPMVPRSHGEVLRTTGLVVGSIGDRR
jgi:hypothetical protein